MVTHYISIDTKTAKMGDKLSKNTKKVTKKAISYKSEAKKLGVMELVSFIRQYTKDSYTSQLESKRLNEELQKLKNLEIEMLRRGKSKDYDTKKKAIENDNIKLYQIIKDQEPKYIDYYKELETKVGFKIDVRNAWDILELTIHIIDNVLKNKPKLN